MNSSYDDDDPSYDGSNESIYYSASTENDESYDDIPTPP